MWILTLLTSFLLLIRWVRSLAFLQQKEYRWDRIWLFWQTEEGRKEWWRVFPTLRDFTRTGFKRPRITLRVGIAAAFSGLLIGLLWVVWVWRGMYVVTILDFAAWVLAGGAVLFLLPLFVLFGAVPTAVGARFVTWCYLLRARQKMRRHAPTVIGITGSYGKTSTKLLLAHVLSSEQTVFVTPKSYNTRLSVARSVLKYSGEAFAVIEYAAYGKGEIATLASWFPPDIAIITGLTEQHLGLFGSRAAIVRAKSELVRALPNAAPVFRNAADPGTQLIVQAGAQGKQLQVHEYAASFEQHGITKVQLSRAGKLEFHLWGKRVRTQLVGQQYLPAVAGVIAVCEVLGAHRERVRAALESFRPQENFVQHYLLKSGAEVIDDGGTSNPAGFRAALKLAAALQAHRVILLTGGIVDTGQKEAEIHAALATAAAKVCSAVLFVGAQGRAAFAKEFRDEYSEGTQKILAKLKQLERGDLLLIEGRIPPEIEEAIRAQRT